MVEMCPWEMAGGACNDETCEYQHVRNIKLPGAWVVCGQHELRLNLVPPLFVHSTDLSRVYR